MVAPLEASTSLRPGVVSLPHGFGHGREGVRLRVAAGHAGVSLNDLTDEGLVDGLCGTAVLSGVPVEVEAVPRPERAERDSRGEPRIESLAAAMAGAGPEASDGAMTEGA